MGRVGSTLAWRPQTRTAALLIGGFFLYFVVVSLRSVPDLVTEAAGNCIGPAGFSGYLCQEPSWARGLATVDLATTIADLAVVAGAAMAFAGHRPGRNVMLGALVGVAAAQIAAIAVTASALQGVGYATTWQAAVSAVAALVLCIVVATMRDT